MLFRSKREGSASTYPCRSLSGSVQVNGVDGVVLAVIQITDDPSAERTAPPRSTHMQPGDVSHALIQQGERERLGKTPSSSSTTAWWWWRSVAIPQGFAKHHGRRGGGREAGLHQREEKYSCLWQPQNSSIYRGKGRAAPPLGFPTPRGGGQPPDGIWCGGQEGGRSPSSPRHLGGAFPLEDSSL